VSSAGQSHILDLVENWWRGPMKVPSRNSEVWRRGRSADSTGREICVRAILIQSSQFNFRPRMSLTYFFLGEEV
jgi:hypothetical protein